MESGKAQDYLERLPPVPELRRQLAANLQEGKLLRKLLRVAEQREQFRKSQPEATR